MSDLSDLASDVSKDLPAQIRKVIDTAIEAGWQLNKPGMTLALRLNHPSDELAQPVYITWVVGRTPQGRLSFKFMSCGTRGLVPLSGADLLEYLKDPTTIYMSDEDVDQATEVSAARAAAKADEKRLPWDQHKPQMDNLNAQIGASVLRIEPIRASDLIADQQSRLSSVPTSTSGSVQPQKAPVRRVAPLRVQIPK